MVAELRGMLGRLRSRRSSDSPPRRPSGPGAAVGAVLEEGGEQQQEGGGAGGRDGSGEGTAGERPVAPSSHQPVSSFVAGGSVGLSA